MRSTSIALVVGSLAVVIGCSGGADYYCALLCADRTPAGAYPKGIPDGQDACESDAVKNACAGGVASCTCNRQGG